MLARWIPQGEPPWSYSIDPPFYHINNYTMFTKVLIAAGYRLFLLVGEQKTWRVWAKSTNPDAIPDLSDFADGIVMPVALDGVEAFGDDVIMLDEADGGAIVYGYGRIIS